MKGKHVSASSNRDSLKLKVLCIFLSILLLTLMIPNGLRAHAEDFVNSQEVSTEIESEEALSADEEEATNEEKSEEVLADDEETEEAEEAEDSLEDESVNDETQANGEENAVIAWTSTTSLPSESGDYKLTMEDEGVALSLTEEHEKDSYLWKAPSGETSIDLNGKDIWNACGSGYGHSIILVNSGSTLKIYDSSSSDVKDHGQIRGGDAYVGGAIIVDGGTFIMEGGQIINNSAANFAGGIYLENFATANIKKGLIENNVVTNSDPNGKGGGILVENANLEIGADVQISNNRASMGAGIAIKNMGSAQNVTINGGLINKNTASTWGGGIEITCGTLNLKDGTITENTARYGAGIDVAYESVSNYDRKGTLNLYGGNTTNNHGEGILSDGLMTLRKGDKPIIISGNTCVPGSSSPNKIQIYDNNKCDLVLMPNCFVNFDSDFGPVENKIPFFCIEYKDGEYKKVEQRKITTNYRTYCDPSQTGHADDIFDYEGSSCMTDFGGQVELKDSKEEVWLVDHVHNWAGIKQETDTSISLWCSSTDCEFSEEHPAKYYLVGEDKEFTGDPVAVGVFDQISDQDGLTGWIVGNISYQGIEGTEYSPTTIAPSLPGKYEASVEVTCNTPPLGQTKVVRASFTITGYAVNISGTVYNSDKSATIAGAKVYWRNLDDTTSDPQGRLYQTISKNDGTYSLLVPGNKNGNTGIDYSTEGYLVDFKTLNTTTSDVDDADWYLYKGHDASVTGEVPGHVSFTATYYKNGQQVSQETTDTIGNILICDGATIYVDENEWLIYELKVAQENTKVTIKANHEEFYETYFWQLGDDIALDIGGDPITVDPNEGSYNIVSRYMPLCKMSITSLDSEHHKNFTYKYRYNDDEYTTGTIDKLEDSTIYASTKVYVDANNHLVTEYSSPAGWDVKKFTLDSETEANAKDESYSVIGWLCNGLAITDNITVTEGITYNFEPVYNKAVAISIASDFELFKFSGFDFTYQVNSQAPIKWTGTEYADSLFSGTEYYVDSSTGNLNYKFEVDWTVPYKEVGLVAPHSIQGANLAGWTCNGQPIAPNTHFKMTEGQDYNFLAIYEADHNTSIQLDLSCTCLNDYSFEYYELGELVDSGVNPDFNNRLLGGTICKVLPDNRLSLSYSVDPSLELNSNKEADVEFVLTANPKANETFLNWLLNGTAFTDQDGTILENGTSHVIGAKFETGNNSENITSNISENISTQTGDSNFFFITTLIMTLFGYIAFVLYRRRKALAK